MPDTLLTEPNYVAEMLQQVKLKKLCLLVALYLLRGLYTFEDRKVMEVVLACFKGTVPATGWRESQ